MYIYLYTYPFEKGGDKSQPPQKEINMVMGGERESAWEALGDISRGRNDRPCHGSVGWGGVVCLSVVCLSCGLTILGRCEGWIGGKSTWR